MVRGPIEQRARRMRARKKYTVSKNPLSDRFCQKGVRFLDLKPGQCHWPFEVDSFCGAQKEKGLLGPYCAKHEDIAHPIRKRKPVDLSADL